MDDNTCNSMMVYFGTAIPTSFFLYIPVSIVSTNRPLMNALMVQNTCHQEPMVKVHISEGVSCMCIMLLWMLLPVPSSAKLYTMSGCMWVPLSGYERNLPLEHNLISTTKSFFLTRIQLKDKRLRTNIKLQIGRMRCVFYIKLNSSQQLSLT